MKKIKRFHRDVYFPPWSEDSLAEFLSKVSEAGYVTFSAHALKRTSECVDEYGKSFLRALLKSVKRGSLNIGQVFEFYSVEETVKKACFRQSVEEISVDFVLVISQDATVITVFAINRDDNHDTLDAGLYESG